MDTTKSNRISITECPRDAMQGLKDIVPFAEKTAYLQSLLAVGFDILDFGSFVSPKAIPQMADTEQVLSELDLSASKTKLLAIVANERGALQAANFQKVTYIGFPFSVSKEFQLRNTNSSLDQAFDLVGRVTEICDKSGKKPNIYISMAFGNPYGELWAPDMVAEWVGRLHNRFGICRFALSDTIGSSNAGSIEGLFTLINGEFPNLDLGAHFHSHPARWKEKAEAALNAGCRNFDGALKGIGGCPMAAEDLVGNMPTEKMVDMFEELGLDTGLDRLALTQSLQKADVLFGRYH